jgi:hypothetical protein
VATERSSLENLELIGQRRRKQSGLSSPQQA